MASARDDTQPPAAPAAPPPGPVVRIRFGLSAKLLVLTVLFVMLAQVCIFMPSIARYRVQWLGNRLSAAYTSALALEAAPREAPVPEELSLRILDSISKGARTLAMKSGQSRRLLVATAELPTEVLQDVDVRDTKLLRSIVEALRTLLVAKD